MYMYRVDIHWIHLNEASPESTILMSMLQNLSFPFCCFLLSRVTITFSTLEKIFSRRHFEIVFFIFPRKQDLPFHANCLQWRQFA